MSHILHSPPPAFVMPPAQAAGRMKSPVFSPLYRQIKALILQALEDGEWVSGAMIPSEIELAKRFGVSQGTVRKAIDELSSENQLVRVQGKGTFVASHSDPHAHYRFLCLRPDEGCALQKRSQPISCAVVEADASVADALAMPCGEPVTMLERVLVINDEAAVLDRAFFPVNVCEGLTLEMLHREQRSLYCLLEERFGIRMIRAEEKLRAVALDAAVAKHLNVPEASPALLVERTAYTYGDKPVEWRRGFYRTDRYHYFNELI